MLIALQNASLPSPFTQGVISPVLRSVSLREWFRAHARVDEEERGQKRDFPVVNRRELEIGRESQGGCVCMSQRNGRGAGWGWVLGRC